MTPAARPSVRLSVALVVVGGVLFVALAAWLVPWQWVPGGRPQHVDATSVFTAAQVRRAQTYSAMQRHLGWASLVVSLAVSLVLGLTPLGARAVRGLPGPWWVRAWLGVAGLLVVGELATLPFALASRRDALRYGLTEQTLAGWSRDQLVSLLVAWATTGVAVLVLLALARRSPRRWPLWAALAGVVLTVAGSWAYPVVVEPLFNRFTPLPPGALRTQILDLARVERVPVSEVLVADASRRTTTLNAYVSGFGSTRRVVLYDTLLHEPRPEILSVVGHELGHARHHDVANGTALGAAGVVAGAGLLGLLLGRRRLLVRAGVPEGLTTEAVALLLALAAVGTLLASPVENTISRAVEARADRAALSSTRDYRSFDRLQVQLAVRSLSDPSPPAWSQFWFGSHPTALQRIGIARALRARGTG